MMIEFSDFSVAYPLLSYGKDGCCRMIEFSPPFRKFFHRCFNVVLGKIGAA